MGRAQGACPWAGPRKPGHGPGQRGKIYTGNTTTIKKTSSYVADFALYFDIMAYGTVPGRLVGTCEAH